MLLPVVCRDSTGSHLFFKPLRYRLGCAVYFRLSPLSLFVFLHVWNIKELGFRKFLLCSPDYSASLC